MAVERERELGRPNFLIAARAFGGAVEWILVGALEMGGWWDGMGLIEEAEEDGKVSRQVGRQAVRLCCRRE